MNLKALAVAALSSAALFAASPAEAGRVTCGSLAGFEDVCVEDNGRGGLDNILIEVVGSVYQVEVNCESGKYRYDTTLGSYNAKNIANAWCGW